MIRHLVFLSILFIFGFGKAASAAADPQRAVIALMNFCIPSIVTGENPAAFAIEQNFPELPAEKASHFFPTAARVFALPGLEGEGVLIAPLEGTSCSIAIRTISAADFWSAVDSVMVPKLSLSLMREKRMEDEKVTKREYEAPRGYGILITGADAPREGGMQILMTAARK